MSQEPNVGAKDSEVPPRLFISYRHENQTHADRVRRFAIALRKKGFDARLDQFEAFYKEGWPSWCAREIVSSKYVLLICTKAYREAFMGLDDYGYGLGVKWEGTIIQNVLYYEDLRGEYERVGFIPIVFSLDDKRHIPPQVVGHSHFFVDVDTHPFDGDYQELVQCLGPPRDDWPSLPTPTRVAATGRGNEQSQKVDSVLTAKVWNCLPRLAAILGALERIHRPPLDLPLEDEVGIGGPRDYGLADLHFTRGLLRYRHRPDAEAELQAFIDAKEPFLWWIIVGEGGVGKSRLALWLARKQYHEERWHTGFLQDNKTATDWLAKECRSWHPRRPTLIVIDYVGHRYTTPLECLEGLADSLSDREAGGPKIRVLLLNRPREFLWILAKLSREYRGNTVRQGKLRKYLFQPQNVAARKAGKVASFRLRPSEMRARPFADEDLLNLSVVPRAEWGQVLTEVTNNVGSAFTPPPDEDVLWWDNVGRLTGNGRLLFLQILGLYMARKPDAALSDTRTRRDLLDEILLHEITVRWHDLFNRNGEEGVHDVIRRPIFLHVVRAAAFITLTRGSIWMDDFPHLVNAVGGSGNENDIYDILPRLLPSQSRAPIASTGQVVDGEIKVGAPGTRLSGRAPSAKRA